MFLVFGLCGVFYGCVLFCMDGGVDSMLVVILCDLVCIVKWIVLLVVVLYVCSVVMMLIVLGSCGDVIELVIDRFRNDMLLNLSWVVSLVECVMSFLCVLMLYMCDVNVGVLCFGCCLKNRLYRMKLRYDLLVL